MALLSLCYSIHSVAGGGGSKSLQLCFPKPTGGFACVYAVSIGGGVKRLPYQAKDKVNFGTFGESGTNDPPVPHTPLV